MLARIKFTAVIIESERGWGVREFSTEAARDAFIKKYNSKNTENVAPDWYMAAYPGENKVVPLKRRNK